MTIWWCKEHRASTWGRFYACLNSSNGRLCHPVEMYLIPADPRLSAMVTILEDVLAVLDREPS